MTAPAVLEHPCPFCGKRVTTVGDALDHLGNPECSEFKNAQSVFLADPRAYGEIKKDGSARWHLAKGWATLEAKEDDS